MREKLMREYERICGALSETDVGSDIYFGLLQELQMIGALIRRDVRLFEASDEDAEEVPGQMQINSHSTEEPSVEEAVAAEEAQEDAQTRKVEEPAAPVELTYDSVREQLQVAAAKGTRIQPIIAAFVPEGEPVKFSKVPKERYGELLEALSNA